MGEEIACENGRISDYQGLVTLTLDRVILHTVMHHSSSCYLQTKFHWNRRNFCGRADGHLRPIGGVDLIKCKEELKAYCAEMLRNAVNKNVLSLFLMVAMRWQSGYPSTRCSMHATGLATLNAPARQTLVWFEGWASRSCWQIADSHVVNKGRVFI